MRDSGDKSENHEEHIHFAFEIYLAKDDTTNLKLYITDWWYVSSINRMYFSGELLYSWVQKVVKDYKANLLISLCLRANISEVPQWIFVLWDSFESLLLALRFAKVL